MKLLVQRISGRSLPKIMEVDDSVVDALLGIMEGQVEVYDLKAEGGTTTSITPVTLNRVRMSVRAFNEAGRMVSCSFGVPHVKPTVKYSELIEAVRGKFNAYWNVDLKADDAAVIYDREPKETT